MGLVHRGVLFNTQPSYWHSLCLPMEGWPGWADVPRWLICLQTVARPSNNRARHRLTLHKHCTSDSCIVFCIVAKFLSVSLLTRKLTKRCTYLDEIMYELVPRQPLEPAFPGCRSKVRVTWVFMWVKCQAVRCYAISYVCQKLQTHSLGGANSGCVPLTYSWSWFMRRCTGMARGQYLALSKAWRSCCDCICCSNCEDVASWSCAAWITTGLGKLSVCLCVSIVHCTALIYRVCRKNCTILGVD